jgi:hypothetical protein
VQTYPHGAVNFEGKNVMEKDGELRKKSQLENWRENLPVPCARGQWERWVYWDMFTGR